MVSVLLIEPNDMVREGLMGPFQEAGHRLIPAGDLFQALHLIKTEKPPIIILDVHDDQEDCLEPLDHILAAHSDVKILITSAFSRTTTVVDGIRRGASDFVIKPYAPDDLIRRVDQLLLRKTEEDPAQSGSNAEGASRENTSAKRLIGRSQPITALRQLITGIADNDETVLITGESGVGKTLVATLIHETSRRANKPLLSINCAAFSDPVFLEGELFGFVRGAFPGRGCLVKGCSSKETVERCSSKRSVSCPSIPKPSCFISWRRESSCVSAKARP